MSTNHPLRDWIGKEVGMSGWIEITQDKIDAHAATTGDDSWIHTDPTRAKSQTPFNSTIAQSLLLLSCLSDMAKSIRLPMEGIDYRLNYGFDRVRIITPVPVGSRIRGRFELKKIEPKGHHGLLLYLDAAIELEGNDLIPAVAAEWLAYLHLTD